MITLSLLGISDLVSNYGLWLLIGIAVMAVGTDRGLAQPRTAAKHGSPAAENAGQSDA